MYMYTDWIWSVLDCWTFLMTGVTGVKYLDITLDLNTFSYTIQLKKSMLLAQPDCYHEPA